MVCVWLNYNFFSNKTYFGFQKLDIVRSLIIWVWKYRLICWYIFNIQMYQFLFHDFSLILAEFIYLLPLAYAFFMVILNNAEIENRFRNLYGPKCQVYRPHCSIILELWSGYECMYMYKYRENKLIKIFFKSIIAMVSLFLVLIFSYCIQKRTWGHIWSNDRQICFLYISPGDYCR